MNRSPKIDEELRQTQPERIFKLNQAGSIKIISSLEQLGVEERAVLEAIADPVRGGKRARPEVMREVLQTLCKRRYLGLRALTELLGRKDSDYLRDKVLNPMVKEGLLVRAYPRPNDPWQAYVSAASAD